jgi:hypothetical protein
MGPLLGPLNHLDSIPNGSIAMPMTVPVLPNGRGSPATCASAALASINPGAIVTAITQILFIAVLLGAPALLIHLAPKLGLPLKS